LFNFQYFGILLETVTNVTLDSNVVVGVFMGKFNLAGGIVGCGLDAGGDTCQYSIVNNIVGGVTAQSCFVAYGHNCGDYSQTVFRNNVAHSCKNAGAVIFPDPNSAAQTTCMEASYYYAYKTLDEAAISFFSVPTQMYSHMVLVDNQYGPAVMGGMEGDNLWTKMNNITIWGESVMTDCSFDA